MRLCVAYCGFSGFIFIGAFSTITAVGISTSISTAMGSNNIKEISNIKGSSLYITVGMAILAGLVQIPLIAPVINSYELSPEMHTMVWHYGLGIMISAPFSLISTVGTLQLQIAGKMKVLMLLTITEGLFNLAFDLLFVAALHMGVEGTGFGTLCANLIRCISTVIYLFKRTDFYKTELKKPSLRLVISILRYGLPETVFPIINAFQNYLTLRIVMNIFGMEGTIINGTATFCLNMSIKPEDAAEASKKVQQFADEIGVDQSVAYKIALCMEEMAAYTKSANKFSVI